MSERGALRSRQWVSLPGGSCDVRIGTDLIEECAPVLKGSVGRPRASVIVAAVDVSAELVERLRRQLSDAGFTAAELRVPAGRDARTLDAAERLLAGLSELAITADDLVVAVGDADALSLASWTCAQWCAGTPLVMVPTGQVGLVEAAITPRGLAVAGRDRVLSLRPATKHVLFDVDVALHEQTDEDALMARAIMVVSAMCDSEAAFSRLWDRTEAICAGDVATLCEQLKDTVKSRGKAASSTALATRQSLAYGEAFAAALVRLVGDAVAPSTARAEALRFQARLSAGEGRFEVDDVLAQDELLERLELPTMRADVDPEQLVAAIREERFVRTNRFLLGLPRKLGRVRLAAVSDELIGEHVAAWCAARSVAGSSSMMEPTSEQSV